jgi:hypothetical protein
MVSVPVACDQLPNSCGSPLQLSDGRVPEIEPNESKRSLSMDYTGVSCDDRASADAPERATVASSINQKMKENVIPSTTELVENGSSKRLFDVRLVGEEKHSSGNGNLNIYTIKVSSVSMHLQLTTWSHMVSMHY